MLVIEHVCSSMTILAVSRAAVLYWGFLSALREKPL